MNPTWSNNVCSGESASRPALSTPWFSRRRTMQIQLVNYFLWNIEPQFDQTPTKYSSSSSPHHQGHLCVYSRVRAQGSTSSWTVIDPIFGVEGGTRKFHPQEKRQFLKCIYYLCLNKSVMMSQRRMCRTLCYCVEVHHITVVTEPSLRVLEWGPWRDGGVLL